MNELRDRLNAMKNDWYSRMDDITDELRDMGIDPDECYISREYISFTAEIDGEDTDVMIRLGGTERTIAIDSIEF